MASKASIRLVVVLAALATSSSAAAATNLQIPGLQVALRAQGLYHGPIDGIAGPGTKAGVRAFQQRAGLTVDGIAGLQTRVALGRLGRPLLGRRVLRRGLVGWDVSVLQYLLRRKGVLRGGIDGRFGGQTTRALRRFQRRAGLIVDGLAGPATIRALGAGSAAAPRQDPAPSAVIHVVRAGESWYGIAARYGISPTALAHANGRTIGYVLLVGMKLTVPGMNARASADAAAATPASSVKSSLNRWAAYYGVDPRLVRALAWMESGFQNHVVSPAGAAGVMQVTPAAWAFAEMMLIGQHVPRTADGNVRVGVALLRHQLREFDGSEPLALAAYYQGAAAVRSNGVLPVTRAYVADVLALKLRV
jgi:peptidoglycan hydrolase-like protein with peptidoglycan-binding domain